LIRGERTALAGMLNAAVLNLRVAVSLVGAVIILSTLYPVLALLPVLGLPALAANSYATNLAAKARERGAPSTRLRDHLFRTAASPSAGKELRIYGLLDEILARHTTITKRLERDGTSAALRGFAATTAAEILFAC